MFYFNARSVRSHHGFGAKSMMPYPRGRQHAGTMRPGRRKKPSSFIQGVGDLDLELGLAERTNVLRPRAGRQESELPRCLPPFHSYDPRHLSDAMTE